MHKAGFEAHEADVGLNDICRDLPNRYDSLMERQIRRSEASGASQRIDLTTLISAGEKSDMPGSIVVIL